MKTLLITGAAGFIGSHAVDYFLGQYPDYFIINLDLLTYASHERNYGHLMNHPRYRLVEGDICDRSLLATLFETFPINGIINYAAESHVDNSIAKLRLLSIPM